MDHITHDGDTWRVLSRGSVRRVCSRVEVLCHLASTTRFCRACNGNHPIQICDWVDAEVLGGKLAVAA